MTVKILLIINVMLILSGLLYSAESVIFKRGKEDIVGGLKTVLFLVVAFDTSVVFAFIIALLFCI